MIEIIRLGHMASVLKNWIFQCKCHFHIEQD